ncbi:MAG: insulinase family protein [Cyclobacteriaceae bacterium]|nr:insulinase family protein [Cyclobacteriaceae bacterium]
MVKDHHVFSFPNDIRFVYKQVKNTKVFHCGFIVDVGSRDEMPDEQGLAHFWEHMAFKGTEKRRAFHIINRLESVGGELNAFTTKEKISFYASVLEDHLEKAIDLLVDITFNSVFPEKQIERERLVIMDELAMYNDSPEDNLQDEFDEVVFGDHSLGKNILGTEESLRNFHKNHFHEFIRQNLSGQRIIFSAVGAASFRQVLKIAEKYLASIPVFQVDRQRINPRFLYGQTILRNKSFGRSYCAIGRDAYHLNDDRRYPFFLLTNILGGPGLNSRLNLSLREKYGYVYSVDASYHGYTDSGMTAIFFGTEKKYLDRSIRIILKEIEKLKSQRLGTVQFHKAKQQIMGQLAIAEENNVNLMLMMGRSLLDIHKIETLEEVFDKISRITSFQVMEVANEIYEKEKLNYLIFQPN